MVYQKMDLTHFCSDNTRFSLKNYINKRVFFPCWMHICSRKQEPLRMYCSIVAPVHAGDKVIEHCELCCLISAFHYVVSSFSTSDMPQFHTLQAVTNLSIIKNPLVD